MNLGSHSAVVMIANTVSSGNWAAWISAGAEVVQAISAVAALVVAVVAVVVGAAMFLVSVVTLWITFKLLKQVELAQQQLRLTKEIHEEEVRWNRLAGSVSHFLNTEFATKRKLAAVALKRIGIDLCFQKDPLSGKQVDDIIADANLFQDVNDYLNLLEDYAEAVSRKVIDPDYARSNMGFVIVRNERVFRPFIEEDRRRSETPDLYGRLEWLAQSWSGAPR